MCACVVGVDFLYLTSCLTSKSSAAVGRNSGSLTRHLLIKLLNKFDLKFQNKEMSVIFEIDANRFVPKDYFELKNDNVQEL